jgi:MSHA biogenesis protein MshM
MFRMRAAGYKGPNIFSSPALKLIADTSNGFMRRVNILADKSLLAAFVEDTYYIKPQHVQAAIRDSELSPVHSLPGKKLIMGGAAAALVLIGAAAWWMLEKPQVSPRQTQDKLSTQDNPPTLAVAPAAPVIAAQTNSSTLSAVAANQASTPTKVAPGEAPKPALNQKPMAGNTALMTPPPAPVINSNSSTGQSSLFEQRLAAGKQLLGQKKAVASIQLFYKEEFKQERIEGFLNRADGLGVLSEIYLVPARFGNKDGLRILYGAYPSINAARNAIKKLPKRYQEAFATSIYIFQ